MGEFFLTWNQLVNEDSWLSQLSFNDFIQSCFYYHFRLPNVGGFTILHGMDNFANHSDDVLTPHAVVKDTFIQGT